jgi:hypothetical protein
MTARALIRQAAITRALKAADRAGFNAAEIRPDGTVLVFKAGEIERPKVEPNSFEAKYGDPR